MTRSILYEIKMFAMKAKVRFHNRNGAVVLALILCCAGLVVRANSGLGTAPGHSKEAAIVEPASPAAPQAKAGERVITVRFNLFDLGIYPREVHVPKGLLAITIEDYSGGAPGIVVEREVGLGREQVGAVQREVGLSRGKNNMRLTPGRYQVYMADRPGNRALLVVEP